MNHIFQKILSILPLTTLKAKFALAFSAYFFLVILIITTFYWFDNQKNKFNQVATTLYQINHNLKKADNIEKDFFNNESINPKFYQSDGKSLYILKYNTALRKILKDLQDLKLSPQVIENEIDTDIDTLSILINQYQHIFNTLTRLQKIRGFKDYGLEGKMRDFIHQLENKDYKINQTILLTIRRHEKDFFLRKEGVYIERWQNQVNDLIEEINEQKNNKNKEEILYLLSNYKATFLELTRIEAQIGYSNNMGFRQQISQISTLLEKKLEIIDQKISQKIEELVNNINQRVAILIVICLILNILLAVTVYRKLSRPIKYLSLSIHEIIQSNFDEKIELYPYEANDEIGRLAKDFKFMVKSLRFKTQELQVTNEELSQQAEEIIAQRDNIEHFSRQLVKINEDMTASLNYAKRIQNALLSFDKKMSHALPQHFVFFKPRDIVSGDFYWFAEKGNKVIIAAVDCTGHGVPGAFMSMIGNTLLNQIVHDREIHEPHLILNELHKGVWQTLRQEDHAIKDGMDISLCTIDFANKSLTFAGARHPLLIIQNNHYELIKGDKISIGENADYSYTPHIFDIQVPTSFYIFSDGYADQFGGENNKKFSIQKLKELLLSISLEDMETQKNRVEQALAQWQNTHKQIDDILLIGFKV
ncbi:MAG: hypothetical protein OHK0057_30470 [Thermoflexibacter sp.]